MLNEFLNPASVEFREVDRAVVKDFVEKHYLGAYPAAAKLYLGIFYNNEMVGMVIYGSPFGPNVIYSMFSADTGILMKNVLELKRLFLTDDENLLPSDAKKNLAGFAISKGNDYVANKFPDVKAIVTYSDSSHHSGTVYKATNAIYQGELNDKKRWVYPIGSSSQRNWVKRNLRSNLDWKATNECMSVLKTMWREVL